jgi:uncharacterized protein YjbI with pentapeptide repeats/membrane protein implicated in regulation of membrane protease activity
MQRLVDRYLRPAATALIAAVRRPPLVVSTVLVVLGVVAVAPLRWWRYLWAATVTAGWHWLPVLLLVAGLAGLTTRGAVALLRRRQTLTAQRRPREPVAVWLPLSAHVAGLLLLAVLVAAGVGALLWWALGSPAGGATPALEDAWTVQNTFDLVKIVLSVVAGIGAVVALTVAYRKQDQSESAERREDTKLFNERFGRAADQLGAEQAAVRLAGVYAMAGLADDWRDGRQTCIDVLCAFLRMPYTPPNGPLDSPPTGSSADPAIEPVPDAPSTRSGRQPVEERQVRHTVLRVIRDHLQPGDGSRWHGHHFDLTNAVFDGGDLSRIDVAVGTILDFAGATFSDGTVSFTAAMFSGGWVSFAGATFSGGWVGFDGARLAGGTVSFTRATFAGGTVSFTRATFAGGLVTFHGATFAGGTVGFASATFAGGTVSFDSATFSHGAVGFGRATFVGGTVSFDSATFSGATVTFTYATFSDGAVRFSRATFASGRVGLTNARFSGGRVGFANARFSGGLVDLTEPKDWSRPPRPLDGASAGVGLPSADQLAKIGKDSTQLGL